ncbi:seryl-tRNA synthetase [Candidatus Tremblaya phenacola PAVE]|nr:seryl-tRNA synthetase [Candidatus Tremblaya phenacola PAVE]
MLSIIRTATPYYKIRGRVKRNVERRLKRQSSWDGRHLNNLLKAHRCLIKQRGKGGCLKSESVKIFNGLLFEILLAPNQLHFSVPYASSIPKDWGKGTIVWHKAKGSHFVFSKRLGFDANAGLEVAGSKFSILREPMSSWDRILTQLMLEVQTKRHHYEEVGISHLIKEEALYFVGHLPKFREEMFKVSGAQLNLFLIPTSEVVLVSLVQNKVLESSALPKRLVAFSFCFRFERGRYGKENRGLLRQRQFSKVEIVQIAPEASSYRTLDEVLRDAEAVLQKLGISYRLLEVGSADVGSSSAKTFDVEVWLPSLGLYKEVSSCSNTESFQSQRLQTKYLLGSSQHFAHIINGSGLAVGRALTAVLEQATNSKWKGD